MNSRTQLLMGSLLVVALALAGCAGAAAEPTGAPTEAPTEAPMEEPTEAPTATPEPEPTPLVFTDSMGREVTLEAVPERIVSMSPSNTEILFALDAQDQIVGRDDFSDYPEAALDIPSIGSTFGELNTETIVELEPDLVLAAGITPPEHIETLESVGLNVFVLGNPTDFPGLFENVKTVGELTGHQDEAQALAADMQARYDDIVQKMEGAELVTVYYEVDGTDPSSPWTTGSGTFQDLAITLAGGENIFAPDFEGWSQVNQEEIVVRDPTKIVFADGPFVPTTVESVKERSGWGGLSAVQNDEVYAMNTDLLDLPGPRLVEGLEAMAQILHPEMFSE